jgi:hypothetical protein
VSRLIEQVLRGPVTELQDTEEVCFLAGSIPVPGFTAACGARKTPGNGNGDGVSREEPCARGPLTSIMELLADAHYSLCAGLAVSFLFERGQ